METDNIQGSIPTRYNPSTVEEKWIELWGLEELSGINHDTDKPTFSMILPPPNVTGALHMGHALTSTVQDMIVRWKKMSGFNTVWIPGIDHAGIATQTVVEKELLKKSNIILRNLTRDEALKHIWAWKEKYSHRILEQEKRLGTLHDWSRLRFSMDEISSNATRKAFKMAYDACLIYRGNYLVNWDYGSKTALSDDEVVYNESETILYYILYDVVDGSTIEIATTRPETIFGDTAVAANTNDSRYFHLSGKNVIVPIVDRNIPVIFDEKVTEEFGSGIVKITPFHDHFDYEIASSHNLPGISIFDENGKMNNLCPGFEGLTIEEARKMVAKKLYALNKISRTESYTHRKGISYRSGSTIEPRMSKQWFFKLSSFKEDLLNAVFSGEVKLLPSKHWEDSYFKWVNKLRDWCISRQLIWGHRLPIWYNKIDNTILCHDGPDIPKDILQNKDTWEEETDVMDTWFSSALWPLSTLGWPSQSQDLDKFYPNNVLETGADILFFWVTKMMVMCRFLTGKWPFRDVYLHGLIYSKSYWTIDGDTINYVTSKQKEFLDKEGTIPHDIKSKWEKMSKSKGNVIDPVEVSSKYGTDSVRMSLISLLTGGIELDLEYSKFESYRNFTNKIWNASRFVILNLKNCSTDNFSPNLLSSQNLIEDSWILSKWGHLVRDVNSHMNEYKFLDTLKAMYSFFWHDFCDCYLETSKPFLYSKVGTEENLNRKRTIIANILLGFIRLIHPIAPFITEEILLTFKNIISCNSTLSFSEDKLISENLDLLNKKSVVLSVYPCSHEYLIDEENEHKFEFLRSLVSATRKLQSENNIHPAMALNIFIEGALTDLIQKHEQSLRSLLKIDLLTLHSPKCNTNYTMSVCKEHKIFIQATSKKTKTFTKEIELLENRIEGLSKLLQDESFLIKAPKHVVEKQKNALESCKRELHILKSNQH